MNIKGLLIAGLVLSTSLANAQGGTSSTRSTDLNERGFAARGVRVGVFMPILEREMEYEFKSIGNAKFGSNEEKIDRTLGASIGYASLPVGRVGFDGNFALMEMSDKDDRDGDTSSVTLARIDGNVGYAVNEIFYFKGGLNISGFTQSKLREQYGPSVGLQGYLGFQATPNMGAEIGYVSMSQRGEIKNSLFGEVEVTTRERGLELRLNGTF